MNDRVSALAAIGSDLYAGGDFTAAGFMLANYIAKWDGSSWSPLGSGMGGAHPTIEDLAVSGSDLYAGGRFTTAGGVSANNVAKWDGSTWSALGSGTDNPVRTLAVSGSDLYAGGYLTAAGGVSANHIAKWDGSTWSALGTGTYGVGGPWSNPSVSGLAVSGDALFVGGGFTTVGGKVSGRFAVWQPRVNVSTVQLSAAPGAVTLGNDVYGFYKPALITDGGTTVSYAGGLPVDVTMERAPEIHINGHRVNGAFTLEPEGVTFGGTGATLRVEFSEDDAAAYGALPWEFEVFQLSYPPDYPANKEATTYPIPDGGTPYPIRIENGRQIYAIEVPISAIGSTYGAIPVSAVPQTGVEAWRRYE
jgi:hypothetical protein